MNSKFNSEFLDYYLVYDHHIKYVLKSGLLLEEDMEVLLSNYYFNYDKLEKKKLSPLKVLLESMSIAMTAYAIYEGLPMVVPVITASPVIVTSVRTLHQVFVENEQKQNVRRMVEGIKNIAKLNQSVCHYFRSRKFDIPERAKIINPYTHSMEELMITIFRTEVNILKVLKYFINDFYSIVPSMNDCYGYIENIDLDDFDIKKISDVKDCFDLLKNLCDIFRLIVSHALTCFGLLLCPSLWGKPDIDINKILNKIVLELRNLAIDCSCQVSMRFNNVKYHFMSNKLDEFQIKNSKQENNNKLQIVSYDAIAKTSDIVEKSQYIFKNLEKVNMGSLAEREQLAKCIADLRDHVFNYYESLEVLCKLYDISFNAPSQKITKSADQAITQTLFENETIDLSNELTEPLEDEEFELYINDDVEPSEFNDYDFEAEEEARKVASALYRELKQSLRSHSRFAEARKKHNILDEDVQKSLKPKPVVVEKDDRTAEFVLPILPPLPIEKSSVSTAGSEQAMVPLPPPPPPPLQLLTPLIVNPGPNTDSNFLDDIRVISANRAFAEEIFTADSEESH